VRGKGDVKEEIIEKKLPVDIGTVPSGEKIRHQAG
jgi:hypothetical protein